MKKILIVLQILVVVVMVLKVVTTGHLFGRMDLSQMIIKSALAGSPPPGPAALALKDVEEDELKKERDLYSVLEKRLADLNVRENSLREEEKKLAALKKEIQDKIDTLLLLEKRLDAKLEAEKEEDTKRYKTLAKIIENTIPTKAGAMLEKLDNKTAAGIAMVMKKEKAGIVLSHVSVQKVVEITREITKNSSNLPEKGTR